MTAYYNEIDPLAAAWLRELIANHHIAPGYVDERSIAEVRATDLAGFTQCHFFAGIGVWSAALRGAGWSDDRPVWTGSCPCQPFSGSGKKKGFADDRHLWPDFFRLISECRPDAVFGEQVASKHGLAWLDLVHADLEGAGYAVGEADLCAAGIGAPHIRQRLYWVADSCGLALANGERGRSGELGSKDATDAGLAGKAHVLGDTTSRGRGERGDAAFSRSRGHADGAGLVSGLADDDAHGCRGLAPARLHERRDGASGGESASRGTDGPRRDDAAGCSESRGVGDSYDARREGDGLQPLLGGRDRGESLASDAGPGAVGVVADKGRPGPVNGEWGNADWLLCRDGKWRPVESRPQPLADGSAESLGRVRAGALAAIKEEIDASPMEGEIRDPSTVRTLRDVLGAEAQRVWSAGGIPRLHEAPFLLAFLRQLEEQGWPLTEDGALPRAEAANVVLRGVRSDEALAGAPCERGLVGQPTRECADAVHFLSSLLARHAQAAWGHAHRTYAEIGFPLHVGARSRVARLRGYGNAIVKPLAEAFIEAYLEAKSDMAEGGLMP